MVVVVVVVAGSSVSVTGACVRSVDVTPSGPEWRRTGSIFELLLVRKLVFRWMSNQFFNGIKSIPFLKNDVFIFHFQYPILKKKRHCTTFTLMIEKTPYFMRGKIRILHSNSHVELMVNVSIARNVFTT